MVASVRAVLSLALPSTLGLPGTLGRTLGVGLLGIGLFGSTLACGAEVETVPEGALARIGDEVVEEALLEGAQARLGAYGQARFRGPEGQRGLVDALIVESLLVMEAEDAGLAADPLVEWAVFEELARIQRSAMLERRLPRTEVESDERALAARAALARAEVGDDSRFSTAERRRMRALKFSTFDEAERVLARLNTGALDLEALAEEEGLEVLVTSFMRRDDEEFPYYHDLLFDPALAIGEPLAQPVLSGTIVLVGVLDAVEAERVRGLDDAGLREWVVGAEYAVRAEPVEAAMLEELRERYPSVDDRSD